jgi:hypothetical protein
LPGVVLWRPRLIGESSVLYEPLVLDLSPSGDGAVRRRLAHPHFHPEDGRGQYSSLRPEYSCTFTVCCSVILGHKATQSFPTCALGLHILSNEWNVYHSQGLCQPMREEESIRSKIYLHCA